MFIYTAVSKMLMYPTSLCEYCGRDLLFAALIDFVIGAVVIWAVSYLCSRTEKTFFELLENTFGNIVARIIYGTFAAFFMICALYSVFEQKLYVHAIFYDTVPSLLVFLPFFAFAVYAGSKGFRNIGRSADICLPIFLIAMAMVLAMSALEVDVSNLLPVLRTPAKTVFGAALKTFFRFAEPAWLLMLMGHYKYQKRDAAKITLSYILGAITVLSFLLVFYGIYGDIASSRQFAISKISLYFPAIEIVGRVDLIALYILEIVMLFASVLNIQFAVHCIEKCSGYDNKPLLSVAVNSVLLILLVTLDHYFNAINEVYANWMWIVFAVFAIIMPLLAWALRRRERS